MINIQFFEENSFKQRLKRIDFSWFILQEESRKEKKIVFSKHYLHYFPETTTLQKCSV